jgi:hypothetical protein
MTSTEESLKSVRRIHYTLVAVSAALLVMVVAPNPAARLRVARAEIRDLENGALGTSWPRWVKNRLELENLRSQPARARTSRVLYGSPAERTLEVLFAALADTLPLPPNGGVVQLLLSANGGTLVEPHVDELVPAPRPRELDGVSLSELAALVEGDSSPLVARLGPPDSAFLRRTVGAVRVSTNSTFAVLGLVCARQSPLRRLVSQIGIKLPPDMDEIAAAAKGVLYCEAPGVDIRITVSTRAPSANPPGLARPSSLRMSVTQRADATVHVLDFPLSYDTTPDISVRSFWTDSLTERIRRAIRTLPGETPVRDIREFYSRDGVFLPESRPVWGLVKDSSAAGAIQRLDSEITAQEKTVAFLGLTINESVGAFAGPFVICIVLVYLGLHVGALRRAGARGAARELRDWPVVLLFEGAGGEVAAAMTLLALPAAGAAAVVWRAWRSLTIEPHRMHWYASLVLAVLIAGLWTYLRIRGLRRAIYTRPRYWQDVRRLRGSAM